MSNRINIQSKVRKLVFIAMLSAIVLLMATTPLGYLRLGPVSITFLAIPVVVAGIVLGPVEGTIVGLIFGATSFAQCFGADPLGTSLFAVNPFLTGVMCFLPRLLIGLFSGLSFRFFSNIIRNTNTRYISASYVASSLVGSFTNSIFFIGLMLLFFWNTPEIQSFGDDVLTVLSVLFTANVFIEAGVCLVLSASLSKVLSFLTKKYTSQ